MNSHVDRRKAWPWLSIAVLLACSAGLFAPTASAESTSDRHLAEAREAFTQLVQQVGGELSREYKLSGATRSVLVCKYTALEVAARVSKRFGAQVRRVSLKVRNPALGMPDTWEQETLLDFSRRAAAGEPPAQLERTEVVSEPGGRYFRYSRAIPMAELCLNCHGPRDTMSPATIAQIDAEYPHDQATGYVLGEIRGVLSFKKPY